MESHGTHGWNWQETHRPAVLGLHGERTIWTAMVHGMFYPDNSPVEIHAERGPKNDRWYVSDNEGALTSSRAPGGVIGTLMARTEGFFDIDMTGDGHFYQTVPHLPARTRWNRIEQAAMRVAAYSVFMAWANPPDWWPPKIVITMTPQQALEHGLYDHRSRQAAAPK